MARVTTIAEEMPDTAHEVTYVVRVSFKNRIVSPEQREAFAKLARIRAREMTVFASMIAQGTSSVEMQRISSAMGTSTIDVMHEPFEE